MGGTPIPGHRLYTHPNHGGFSYSVQALWHRPPLPDMTSVCEWGHRPLCPRVVRRGPCPCPGYNVAGRVPGSCAPTNQRGTAGDTCTVGYTYLIGQQGVRQAGRAALTAAGAPSSCSNSFGLRGDGFWGRRTSRTSRTSRSSRASRSSCSSRTSRSSRASRTSAADGFFKGRRLRGAADFTVLMDFKVFACFSVFSVCTVLMNFKGFAGFSGFTVFTDFKDFFGGWVLHRAGGRFRVGRWSGASSVGVAGSSAGGGRKSSRGGRLHGLHRLRVPHRLHGFHGLHGQQVGCTGVPEEVSA